MRKSSFIATLFVFSTSAFAATPTAGMGKGLYTQTGANSCLYCHGVDGSGGNVKSAAKLNQPSTWKIYKVLGGKAAAEKNKADFLAKMKEATIHLIERGAIIHNAAFKKPWFDLSKAGSSYDAQMLGISGAPSKSWLKKFASKGVTPTIASESVYLHVQTLDKEKFFK